MTSTETSPFPGEAYRIGWTVHRGWRSNVKHLALPHRPWQAEAEGLRFARRGIRRATAIRRISHDFAYQERTGRPSFAQRRLVWWRSTAPRRVWGSLKDRTYAKPPQRAGVSS
jgi:hypothetical protein